MYTVNFRLHAQLELNSIKSKIVSGVINSNHHIKHPYFYFVSQL